MREGCWGACLSSERSEPGKVLRVGEGGKWRESFLLSLNMQPYAAL